MQCRVGRLHLGFRTGGAEQAKALGLHGPRTPSTPTCQCPPRREEPALDSDPPAHPAALHPARCAREGGRSTPSLHMDTPSTSYAGGSSGISTCRVRRYSSTACGGINSTRAPGSRRGGGVPTQPEPIASLLRVIRDGCAPDGEH